MLFPLLLQNTWQSQVKEERLILDHTPSVHSNMAGKAWWPEFEALITLYPWCDTGSREMNGGD